MGRVGTNGAALGLGIWAAVRVVRTGPLTGAGGVLRADALSAFMVVVIGAIALLASWIGIRTVALELANGQSTQRRATTYGVLVQAFVAAMLLAVLAANVGVLWVAIEATTIVTTFLVGHRRTKGALEASWKYIVICSVGIALAFLGTVLVYLAALHAGGHSADALDWTSLMAHARHLDPSVMRLAFALLVLGYGTKVGLAPMHSWLPDAHSQAPAPISALMSGVLLTVAFYAILRFKAVVDLAVGPGSPGGCSSSWPSCRWPWPPRCCSPNATTSGCSPTTASSTWGSSPSARRRASRSPSPRCCSTSSATAWPRACCS